MQTVEELKAEMVKALGVLAAKSGEYYQSVGFDTRQMGGGSPVCEFMVINGCTVYRGNSIAACLEKVPDDTEKKKLALKDARETVTRLERELAALEPQEHPTPAAAIPETVTAPTEASAN